MSRTVRTVVTVAALCCALSMAPTPAAALDSRFSSSADDADALVRGGDLEGATETLEQALAAAQAIFGNEHPDVAELTSRLSLLYLYRNDVGRAERLAERALALREKIYGKLHPAVATSLMDLASIRLVQGRDEEAGELYRRVVDLWTRVAGSDDVRAVQARANLADFLEARGQLAEAQQLRQTNPQPGESKDARASVPPCASPAAASAAPAWNSELATSVFKIALDHEERIAHALAPTVHHFFALPDKDEFNTIFPTEGERAYELGRQVHALAKQHDAALMSLFALIYLARERLNVAALERDVASPQDAPDYRAIIADVRRRALVGITRFELTRTPGWAAWLDDASSLLARREQIAKLLRPVGFDVNNEIKYRPQFLTCVSDVRPDSAFDYESLRTGAEIIARNATALDGYLRLAGIDVDAVLKAYARARPKGDRGIEEVGPGVQLDRFNKAVFLKQYPTSFVVHLQPSVRDRTADLAALISQWEHGEFPRATRAQLEDVIRTARRYTDTGPLTEMLDATALDLRTRYPAEAAAAQQAVTWKEPRVGRWERTRVDRDQYNTYYELQFDTHGAFALPANDFYLTKRLASPVGMMLGIALRRLDLPKRALDVFAKRPPTLHVAVLPDPGLTFEVYAHPRALNRAPGVTAAVFGETPLRPPPPMGWEFASFPRMSDDAPSEDRMLLDIRPIPGIEPSEARSFGVHVCLLTPLEVWNDGQTVHFSSPIWRNAKDVPTSARFIVYRRKTGTRGAQWEDIAGRPLSLSGGLDYPENRVSPLAAGARNGYVEFSFTDLTADPRKSYEYQVLHRCALKPYPDRPPSAPSRPSSSFEIVSVEHAPASSLRCNVRHGFGGIARPWVRVRYRVRESSAKSWRDNVSVLDPSGHELSGRNAVTTRRDPPQAVSQPGLEYSLLTSVAACTEGPYRFNIRLEGDGFSREIAETLYVSVARDP